MQFGKKPALGIALFLFFASFALRASLTETSPFLSNEAYSLDQALQIAQAPFAGHWGPISSYWAAIPLFFSATPEAANLWTALTGAIAVVFCFFAFREWLSIRGAAIGALLMAYSPWTLLFSDHMGSANSVILPLSAALFFFARWQREPERLGYWLGLVGCIAVIPQFDLAASVFAIALFPLMVPKLREVRAKGWLAGLVLFVTLSAPYAIQEFRTGGANTRTFLAENVRSDARPSARSPLYALRFLTLDGTPFDLGVGGARFPEGTAFETLWKSTPERPLAWPHWMLRLWSWGLAIAIVWVGLRSKSPLRTLFITGVLVNFALLAITRKNFFPHYATALFPFIFGLAALWGEHSLRKRPVLLALVLGAFCIGGTLEATSISRTLHARNSVGEQRKVVEALLAQTEPGTESKVHFTYPTSPETYAFLARTQYGRELRLRAVTPEEADFRAEVAKNGRVTLQKIR